MFHQWCVLACPCPSKVAARASSSSRHQPVVDLTQDSWSWGFAYQLFVKLKWLIHGIYSCYKRTSKLFHCWNYSSGASKPFFCWPEMKWFQIAGLWLHNAGGHDGQRSFAAWKQDQHFKFAVRRAWNWHQNLNFQWCQKIPGPRWTIACTLVGWWTWRRSQWQCVHRSSLWIVRQ